MQERNAESEFTPDELDLLIIGELLRRPEASFKDLASTAKVDQRTISRRVQTMTQKGAISRSIEVNWAELGVKVAAFIGSTTGLGEKSVAKFLEYVKADPRVVEAYETVGTHQYILRALGNDLPDLRNSILRELEPLTADLTTSVISSEVKDRNHFQFIRFLRETRYPRTRSSTWSGEAVVK